jgi:PAS domain S-box-containing protein
MRRDKPTSLKRVPAPVPQRESSLERDAERLSLAMMAAQLGDWSWDPTTDVVTFSHRAAEIVGIAPEQPMKGSAMADLLHPDDRERARVAVARSIAERSDYSIEYRLINGGCERWVSASGRGRYDERGEVVEIFGVLQDITRDRLLVRVDDAVRSLVQPEDITYTAARVLGQYLGVHRCAYAFVEDDEDTFILTGNYTNGVESIVGRYRFRQFGAECLRLMRAGQPYVVEDSEIDDRLDDEDRKAYRLTEIRSVICVPISKSSRFVAAMAVHMKVPRRWSDRDVELVQQVASRCWESIERARVERERAGLLEAAEAANRAKDEFLAMLGHELRNPLAPIVTALHLMRERADETSERERTIIERQVSHLTRLVDDLLDVSRIARGKIELKRERVEIAEVVASAIEVASPLFEQRAHALDLDVAREGLAVDCDAARLVQVVSNLLTNSGKYTPPGGRIMLSAAAEGDEVVLRVRDNGMGMTADALPGVFDLFVQGRQAIDRAHGGLGLGLTIVRSLVERHGGCVSAHSDGPGKGTEMIVRLPRAGAPGTGSTVAIPPLDTAPRLDTKLTAKVVLVVDDNVDAAEMLSAALALHGCQVHVAHDGPDAMRVSRDRTFDAALLDIGLPVMDGYELAARLRELPNFATARLIAVTGYGQQSDRRRALDAGFHHHLVKPVDLGALMAIIASLSAEQCPSP